MENLIVRNNDISYLYDVVSVDFEAEQVNYVEKQLTFEQASEVIQEMNARSTLESN